MRRTSPCTCTPTPAGSPRRWSTAASPVSPPPARTGSRRPAAVPLTGAAVLPDNTPPFGSTVRVYVTAAAGAAKVRVATLTGATRTLQVRAGRTLAWDPVAALGTAAYGPLVFTPAAGGTT